MANFKLNCPLRHNAKTWLITKRLNRNIGEGGLLLVIPCNNLVHGANGEW